LLSRSIADYTRAVSDGELPYAYRGILSALTAFQSAWKKSHPNDAVGALYPGYLDMSFVSFAPEPLRNMRLKVSLVYLHAAGVFSLWLAAGNRTIQAETSAALRGKPIEPYVLCALKPGVDAIIALDLPKPYAFDDPQLLTDTLERAAHSFAADMAALLGGQP
jgi:hypothetical protein